MTIWVRDTDNVVVQMDQNDYVAPVAIDGCTATTLTTEQRASFEQLQAAPCAGIVFSHGSFTAVP